MEFIPEKRTVSGRGDPPPQLLWLHLLRALQGANPPEPLRFGKTTEGAAHIENQRSGESVTLFLNE
jgi:hypothetical protein